MITRLPTASVMTANAAATPAGVAPIAFQHLDTGTLLAFGQRAQPRPALGHRPVVVTVDQVGGLEGGHLDGHTRFTSLPGTTISLTRSLPSRCTFTLGAARHSSLSSSGLASEAA